MTAPSDLVERLRGFLAKATPGPWFHYDEVFRPQFGKRRVTEVQRKDGKAIVCWSGFDGLPAVTSRKSNANAALIAEAVNALPGLLDRIEALATERDEARSIANEAGAVLERQEADRERLKAALESKDRRIAELVSLLTLNGIAHE